MASATAILDSLRTQIDLTDYKKLHREGSFADYLNIVLEQPAVTRTAYQRLYDMILAHGTDDVYENKDKLTRFKFFPAEAAGGLPALKALAGPFGDIRFCPTGGIREETASQWLAHPSVLCVGGSWILPAGERDMAAVTARARAAASLRG